MSLSRRSLKIVNLPAEGRVEMTILPTRQHSFNARFCDCKYFNFLIRVFHYLTAYNRKDYTYLPGESHTDVTCFAASSSNMIFFFENAYAL